MAMGRSRQRDHPEPLGRLVSFSATDGVELAGLLYEPGRATDRAIIWLHGSGGASVFDSARTNLLATLLAERKWAFFPFNNRGSHLVRTLRRRVGGKAERLTGGMAFESIRDCVADIDGAIRFLRQRGYRRFALVGHSTGANKIAVYDHYKPRNPVKQYVLLAGGDDSGGLYESLGARRFASTLARAREMNRSRRGDELAPAGVAGPMSWRSLYDMMNPDGDYNVFPFLEAMRGLRLSRRAKFRYVQGIRKPALFLYGSEDEYGFGDVSGCVAVLADAIGPKPNVEFAIMGGADHGFKGREEELAALIVDWLE